MVNKITPWFIHIFIEPSRSLHYKFQHSPLNRDENWDVTVAWRIVCRRGRAFRWMLHHRLMLCASSPLASLATVHPLCRFNSLGGLGSCGSLECPPHVGC